MQIAQKKKVLYIITKSNWGGAQRYVYDLATELPKENFDVVVAHGGMGELYTKLKEAGVRTIAIPSLKRDIGVRGDIKTFFALLKILKEEGPDIVHLNSSKIGGLGALASRMTHTPKVIFTAHGWAHKENRWWLSRQLIFFLSWMTVLLSHKTIVVSKDDMDNTPKLLAPKKSTMIHNGISNITFIKKEVARNTLRKIMREESIPQNALWIGTISELHKNKGLVYAINAVGDLVRKNKNVLFFILGEGEERSLLTQSIKENRLEKNVFLTGHVPNAPSLLKAFDIFTLTSQKEGLPYTVLEAGLAELPNVASNVGGIPECIDDKKSGMLVQPKNEKEIVNALEFLIENEEKRKMFGAELQKRVRDNFTKEKMVKETLTIYHSQA